MGTEEKQKHCEHFLPRELVDTWQKEVSAECSRIEQTLLGEIGRTEAIARIAEDRAEQAHSALSATSSAVGASAKQLEEKLAEEAVRHAQQARKDLSDAVLVLN